MICIQALFRKNSIELFLYVIKTQILKRPLLVHLDRHVYLKYDLEKMHNLITILFGIFI